MAAHVLPKRLYGCGLRKLTYKMWALWRLDKKSPIIWNNLNKLETKYGLDLDIIYEDQKCNPEKNIPEYISETLH